MVLIKKVLVFFNKFISAQGDMVMPAEWQRKDFLYKFKSGFCWKEDKNST